MKRTFLLVLFACVVCCCIAQKMVTIPYNATSIPDNYRNSNPDYVLYPASLEGKDSIDMTCDLTISSCIEAVDLGLSVKWATCNIGTGYPTGKGQYFAWGEICPKKMYTWDTYKLKYKYHPSYDENTELEACDDVATDFWGEEWRLPTVEEFEELLNLCSWAWDDEYKGYTIYGPNGNSIFLPAAGFRHANNWLSVEERCLYWSKSLNQQNAIQAMSLIITKAFNEKEIGVAEKGHGLSIRPVSP